MSDHHDQPWEPGPDADAGYALFPKEGRVVADDGTPIAYTVRGRDGRRVPFLFADGLSCSDVYWGGLAPRLADAGHPCAIPDLRGHGRSGLPRPPGRGAGNLTVDDLSMSRIARDMVAVLDDAGLSEAVVAGHSMGVQTALEVYRQIPDRVRGLVLIAGSAENPAKTFYGTGIGDRTFPAVAAAVRWFPEALQPFWALLGPARLGHLGARLIRAAGPKASVEDLHPYLLHLHTVDPAVMILMAAAARAHSATDLLPHIDVPTLVVAAGSDVFTPARCSEAIHHAVRGSELVTFPGAGHTLPIEEPEALAALVEDFVSRRVDGRGSSAGDSPGSRPARSRPASRGS